jgi:hypothetical protein
MTGQAQANRPLRIGGLVISAIQVGLVRLIFTSSATSSYCRVTHQKTRTPSDLIMSSFIRYLRSTQASEGFSIAIAERPSSIRAGTHRSKQPNVWWV